MNRIKKLIAISAFSLLVLSLPAIASAQSRNRDRDHDDDHYSNDDRYRNDNRNGRNSRNGDYRDDHRNDNDRYGRNGNNGYYGNMRSVVRSLKNNARELERHLDRDLDNSRHNGSRREDSINREARNFKNAVNRLSESNNGPKENDVRRVLDLGRNLERSLVRSGLINHVSNSWTRVRSDLRTLENAYGYNNNNRYPTNRNGGRNTGNSRLPSWWPF